MTVLGLKHLSWGRYSDRNFVRFLAKSVSVFMAVSFRCPWINKGIDGIGLCRQLRIHLCRKPYILFCGRKRSMSHKGTQDRQSCIWIQPIVRHPHQGMTRGCMTQIMLSGTIVIADMLYIAFGKCPLEPIVGRVAFKGRPSAFINSKAPGSATPFNGMRFRW